MVNCSLSVDQYDDSRSIVRCPFPSANFSVAVNLRRKGQHGCNDGSVQLWETLVYGAALDRGTAVVFVKGLNLRSYRESDPTQFRCHFGLGDLDKGSGFSLTTHAVTAAQEVVWCSLPLSIRKNPDKAQEI
uniref:Uncharacterized protein n=1 Tax=Nelumbo nucifera TaxID=4432 RepID=A0A822YVL3_NELNU|nr:TPA_asm: hypothetical protein HUJ06_007238 [Nelumbo nucifera]